MQMKRRKKKKSHGSQGSLTCDKLVCGQMTGVAEVKQTHPHGRITAKSAFNPYWKKDRE